MRIDLNHVSLQDLARDEKTRKAAVKTSGTTNVEDKTSLSGDTLNISSLAAQAMTAPSIRQDKVEALRQSIQNGDYKIDPDQVAQAILRQNQR
jgi:negative regulator of flagellin synthesis FlgM